MPIPLPTPPPPSEQDTADGLAYTLWMPEREPVAGLVILHGAGSRKESHHDMARAARGAGLAAVAFDQRGHGASDGALDGRMVEDVRTIAGVLPPGLPLVLRGSSMGGAIALLAAEPLGAAAVIAICPAPPELLARGLRTGAFDFRADAPRLLELLETADLGAAIERYRGALLLMHAEGDERVALADTRALHERAAAASPKRLLVVPGGSHSSIQHDDELQSVALRFVTRALRG